MLYSFLKFIFKAALQIFFNEFKVINKEALPTEGPMILVSNHPSTFMDPIIVASIIKPHAHFIAKGTLFNSVLKDWIMRNIMNSIPIYRKQDNPGSLYKNDDVFEQCFLFLEQKGSLIIFPEGTSINERKLQEIKTGTARIALGAEARNDFKLGISIISIGINYSDAPNFRSDVWVNIEKPIKLSKFKEAYQKDDRDAVKKLTNEIRQKLEKNLIITDDDQEDEFIRNVEDIYKNQLVSDLNLDPVLHAFTLTKGIESAVNYYETLDEVWLEKLRIKVANYSRRLKNNNLEDCFLVRDNKSNRNILNDSLLGLLGLLFGAPFYLYGLLTNYLPYHLPKRIAAALTGDDEFVGPIKLTSGIFTFPIYYSILIYIFNQFIAQGNWWWTVFFAISLPLAGFFAMVYYQRFKNFRTHWRLVSLFYKEPKLIGELLQEREEIIKDFDWAKDQYVATVG